MLRRLFLLGVLTVFLTSGPARAEESKPTPFVTAAPHGPAHWLLEAGVTAAASAAVFGLMAWDGGTGPLSRLGTAGQLMLLGGAVALPPAALVAVAGGDFETYWPAVAGGALGLASGYAAPRLFSASPQPLWVGAGAAVGQGVGATLGFELYRLNRPSEQAPLAPSAAPDFDWNRRRDRDYKQP